MRIVAFLILMLTLPLGAEVEELLRARCLGCHSAKALSEAGTKVVAMVESGRMPKASARLTAAELSELRQWVEAGSPEPKAKPVFWSFKSPAKGLLDSIDEAIGIKLGEKRLTPNGKADERTLIRRLHFDLTGLPPRPEDYGLGYRETVEKLLASPRYAERWARHWLDVVRFGETDGGEHNYERFHAWPYRDYVIESLLQDKPYNRFVKEQIAGDLMYPGEARGVAATGFLVAGPWDQVSAELNKDKVLAMTARVDELDDMATTTFHTFQALTVNCARCHDHKFDPIPSKDFYRLTAVFGGVTFGTRQVASEAEAAAYEAKVKPIRERLAGVNQRIAAVEDPTRARLLLERYQAFDAQRGKGGRRIPLNPVWNWNEFASTRARKFRLVITSAQGDRAQLEHLELKPAGLQWNGWKAERKASVEEPVLVELANPAGAAVERVEWWSDRKTARNVGMPKVFRLEALDGDGQWRELCSSLDHVRDLELEMPRVREDELPERKELLAERKRIEAELAGIPPPERIYAAKPKAMERAFLLERGSVAKPVEQVSPGALSAVRQLDPGMGLSREAGDRERRLGLADWIASEKNPLTARVIVNRVWHWHFGNGIVNTPSDFGLNGDRPSHPELLDWLAVRFMENGWSLKWLHREILLSEAYQRSGAMNEKAFAADADNRLLWRMPLKRMDAETLRDTMLAVSGQLRLEPAGGPGFVLQKKKDRGAFIYEALDNDGPEVWRRSVYRFVVRGGERILLDSFDCPDPSVATPQRSVSNTPVQALTLLNNGFVLRQAGLLAERVVKEAGPQRDRQIERAYELVYGRRPSEREARLGRDFIARHGLALYARALFNTNEFLYVP